MISKCNLHFYSNLNPLTELRSKVGDALLSYWGGGEIFVFILSSEAVIVTGCYKISDQLYDYKNQTIQNSKNIFINCYYKIYVETDFFFLWRCSPTRAMASSFLRFLDHTQRRTTLGSTPLEG